jgi:hypothetical protein
VVLFVSLVPFCGFVPFCGALTGDVDEALDVAYGGE